MKPCVRRYHQQLQTKLITRLITRYNYSSSISKDLSRSGIDFLENNFDLAPLLDEEPSVELLLLELLLDFLSLAGDTLDWHTEQFLASLADEWECGAGVCSVADGSGDGGGGKSPEVPAAVPDAAAPPLLADEARLLLLLPADLVVFGSRGGGGGFSLEPFLPFPVTGGSVPGCWADDGGADDAAAPSGWADWFDAEVLLELIGCLQV